MAPQRRYIQNQLLNPEYEKELPETAAAILDLLCSKQLFDCLHALDREQEYAIHQVILFFVGPASSVHIDGWFLDTTPHGLMHTVWIPLETLTLRNGPTCVYRWPREHFVRGKTLGLSDSIFVDEDPDLRNYHGYQSKLTEHVRAQQPAAMMMQMKPGDFAIWGSLTPHGTLPAAEEGASRLSMQVLVRPSRLPFGSFHQIETSNARPDNIGEIQRPGWRLITTAS
jgi:hypothetical protein